MESGLKMDFKTKGNVSVDRESGVCMQDGEGAAPLSSALLSSCAWFGSQQPPTTSK